MNSVLKSSLVALILAAGMVLSASLLSKFFVRIRHEQAITVKGYAESDIVSDIGKMSCTTSARGTNLAEAYDKLQACRTAVLAYLQKSGFQNAEIVAATIYTAKINRRDEQGRETNEIEYYDVYQTFTVTSPNVTLIRDVATGITDLIRDGIDIRASSPAFFITDLKDTKLKLLAAATEDGYRRAVALAENSKGKVGALTSAHQGVFQITERNSTETSSYGEYNTDTIEKTAKAVVTLEYAIDGPR